MRAYAGRIFRLKSHLERLTAAAATLGMTLPDFDLAKACYETLKANGVAEARVRLTLTPGPGEMAPDIATCRSGTVVIGVRRPAPPSDDKYEQGYWAALSAYRRDSMSPLSRIKTTSYIENVLARREARAIGVDEVIMLNEKGFVAEGSITNVFLMRRGVLATPSVESGVLPGITRAVALELAAKAGVKCEEREVRPEEISEADEAFLTNSIVEIMPLTLFAGRPLGPGEPGALTGRLRSEYIQRTCSETENHEACLI